MNKKTLRIAGWALGLSMAVAGVGVAVGVSAKAPVEAKATDVTINSVAYDQVYYTGFENWDAGTNYQSTLNYSTNANEPAAWQMHYGTVSTNAKISGTKSAQMRLYYNHKDEMPYVEMKSDIADVKAYKFSYAVSNAAVRFDVLYSTDSGENWTKQASVAPSGTSSTVLQYTLPSEAATFRMKILVTGGHPDSSNYTFRVDEVFFGKAKSVDDPQVVITNSNLLAPYDVERPLTATPTNAPDGSTITWSTTAGSLSSTSGSSTSLTVSDALSVATSVTVTATLKNSGGTTLDTDTTTFYVSSKAGDNTSNAVWASEAAALAGIAGYPLSGMPLYVKGYANNVGDKIAWLNDTSAATKTFELYHATALNIVPTAGAFVVAHGSLDYYEKGSVPETTGTVIDSSDYFTLGGLTAGELIVDNTQSGDITLSNKQGGDVSWTTVSGTGSVSLSNQSNSGVRVTGTSVGTATVTATVGNYSIDVPVTIQKYASDWTFKDITLEAGVGFKSVYDIDEEFDSTGLTVTLIEHSDTLKEDRETTISNAAVSFNFDSSSSGSFNLTATYGGHTTDDVIEITILDGPAYDVAFGSGGDGSFTEVTAAAADSVQTRYETKAFDGMEWTLKTVSTASKNVRILPSSSYVQIGTNDNPSTEFSLRSNVFGSEKVKITSVRVMAYGGSASSAATLSVTADEGTFTCNSEATASLSGNSKPSSAYEFVSSGAYGHISINFASVSKGYKIESIVVYAMEDTSNKGLAYAFASELEPSYSCESDGKSTLLSKYAALSLETKAIADTLVLYDRPSTSVTYKTQAVTVATKMAYIAEKYSGGSLANSIFGNDLGLSNNSLVVILASLGLTVGVSGVVLVARRRKED